MASRVQEVLQSDNPPAVEYREGVLQWMDAALNEGLGVNRANFNYDKIGETIDGIMGVDEPRILSPRLSKARFNKMQKIFLELRSMLTDLKLFWTYTTNCERYERQADVFGKLAKNWYLRRGIDQVMVDCVDYALAASTGYLHFFWNPDLPGPTDREGQIWQGDIDAIAEDPRDVIPIRFNGGDKRTLQNCRGVIIRRERPTSYFGEMYGKSVYDGDDGVKLDRTGYEKESPSQRRARDLEDNLTQEGPLFKGTSKSTTMGGAPARHVAGPVSVTDEFTSYLHDYSINKSK